MTRIHVGSGKTSQKGNPFIVHDGDGRVRRGNRVAIMGQSVLNHDPGGRYMGEYFVHVWLETDAQVVLYDNGRDPHRKSL